MTSGKTSPLLSTYRPPDHFPSYIAPLSNFLSYGSGTDMDILNYNQSLTDVNFHNLAHL